MNLEEATKMTKEYIKPFALGMGVGAIVVMFSIVGAIFLALFAVIWYPIKRLLRRVKPGGNAEPSVKKGGSAQGPKS
jgi:hypothetical protein